MIQIVMKPDYAIKPKDGENCYGVMFNGEDIGFRVWGKRASHAEEKLMEIFRLDLKGKEVDYDLEAYRKSKLEKKEEPEVAPEEDADGEGPLLPGMEGAR